MHAYLLLSLQENNYAIGSCDVHMHTNTCRCITVTSMHTCLFGLLLDCLFACLFCFSCTELHFVYSGSRQCVKVTDTPADNDSDSRTRGTMHYMLSSELLCVVVVCSAAYCYFVSLLYYFMLLIVCFSLCLFQIMIFQPANWVQDRQCVSMANT